MEARSDRSLQSLIGTEYASKQELKEAITFEVIQRNQSFAVPHSDKKRIRLACRGKAKYDCPFSLNASISGGMFVIKDVVDHTCPAICHHDWKEPHSIKSIASRQQAKIEAFREIKAKHLKVTEVAEHGIHA